MKRIIITAVGLVAIFVFAMIINTYVLRSKAAGEVVTITTFPADSTVKIGEASAIGIMLTAPLGKGISAASIALNGENTAFSEVSNATPLDPQNPTVFSEIQQIKSTDAASIFKSAAAIQSDEKLPQIINFRASFTCSKVGIVKISFDKSKIEVTGNIIGDTYDISGADIVTQVNCVVSDNAPTESKQPIVNAHFIPKTISTVTGGTFSTDFLIDGQPIGKGISAFDMTIKYDPTLVEILKVGDLFDRSFLSALFSTSNLAVASCKADSDCNICPATTTSICKTGICTSAGTCDFTSTDSKPKELPSCKTNQDCFEKAKNAGLCTGSSDTCPIQCGATGMCMPCAAGASCPVGVTPPSVPITPLPSTSIPSPLPQPPQQESGICTKIAKDWNNTKGELHIAYVCILPAEKLPINPAINLTFKVKPALLLTQLPGPRSGTIHIDKAKVAGNIEGDSYQVNVSDAIYTISDDNTSGSGDVKLNLKLKFQGIGAKPLDQLNSLIIKCSIGDGGLITPVSKTAEFKADVNGVWSGTLSYNVPERAGYKVLCKGPKHLQKKICDAVPTETHPGTYSCDKGNISLKKGDNNLDFTGIYLLVGDLPTQDGVTNAYDTSLVTNLLDKDDAESLRLADLNLDGKVNAIDHSLVIAALSIRHDEQ